jgi:uncharacterized protein YndB with AHSA1/START domain
MITVREEVRVDQPPADAFRLFTDGINEWWPLEEGYAYGGDRTRDIHLEARADGRFYERFADGDTLQVGRVTECMPPQRIVFTWKAPDWRGDTEVEVIFVEDGDGTRVTVEHRGFERIGELGDDEAARFGGGWPLVMRRFAESAGRPDRMG